MFTERKDRPKASQEAGRSGKYRKDGKLWHGKDEEKAGGKPIRKNQLPNVQQKGDLFIRSRAAIESAGESAGNAALRCLNRFKMSVMSNRHYWAAIEV